MYLPRCDLKCSYCQVSRADVTAKGLIGTLLQLKFVIVKHNTDEELKIEFQGGEPTLRMDLVQNIITEVMVRHLCYL